jgi:hypothetical protein
MIGACGRHVHAQPRAGLTGWVCRDVGVDPAGAGRAPRPMRAPRGGPRAGMSGRGRQQNRGRPVSHAQSSPEAFMSIGGHASQRPARIGCPNGGMRSGCCKPLFHHPGFHAGRETSTAGGHRLHRRDSPCCGGGMRQAVGGGPSAWVGRTGRLGMPRHLPPRPRRQRGRALGRAPDDPASGQPTTTPCSDRHLAVAVRRGSPPVWPSEATPPTSRTRAGRARSAGSQGIVQSGSAGDDPNRDGCSHGRDGVGDGGRDVCNEGEVDGRWRVRRRASHAMARDRHRSEAFLARRRSAK